MYGYSFNMCFRQVGLRGLFWTSDLGLSGQRDWADVFIVSNSGFRAKSARNHRYGSTNEFQDFLSVIPVTDRDWGE